MGRAPWALVALAVAVVTAVPAAGQVKRAKQQPHQLEAGRFTVVTDRRPERLPEIARRLWAVDRVLRSWLEIPEERLDEPVTLVYLRRSRRMERRLPFLDFAERYFISALHGSGVGDLFAAVEAAYKAAVIKVATPELTRLLERAVHDHQPPLVRGRRIKLRYAHQGGQNPPVIVIHGNQTSRLPQSYKRYLTNYFRKALRLVGTPIRLEFKTGDNPYKDKRNPLTPRQQRSRKRMMRHVKK